MQSEMTPTASLKIAKELYIKTLEDAVQMNSETGPL
jgi:hypothetical protein